MHEFEKLGLVSDVGLVAPPDFAYLPADEALELLKSRAYSREVWEVATEGQLCKTLNLSISALRHYLDDLKKRSNSEQAAWAVKQRLVHPKLLNWNPKGQQIQTIDLKYITGLPEDVIGQFKHRIFSNTDLLFIFPDTNSTEQQQRLDRWRWYFYSAGPYTVVRTKISDPEERAACVDRLARFALWAEEYFEEPKNRKIDAGQWGQISFWELENKIWATYLTLPESPPRKAIAHELADCARRSLHSNKLPNVTAKAIKDIARQTGKGTAWAEEYLRSAMLWREDPIFSGNRQPVCFEEVYVATYGPPFELSANSDGPLGESFGGSSDTFISEIMLKLPKRWLDCFERENGLAPKWTGKVEDLRVQGAGRGLGWRSTAQVVCWPFLHEAQVDKHVFHMQGLEAKLRYESNLRWQLQKVYRAYGAWCMWNARMLQTHLDVRYDFTELLDVGWQKEWIVDMWQYLRTHEGTPSEGFRPLDGMGGKGIAGPHPNDRFASEEERKLYQKFGDRSLSKSFISQPEESTNWRLEDHFPSTIVPAILEKQDSFYPVAVEFTDERLVAMENCICLWSNEGMKVLPQNSRMKWKAIGLNMGGYSDLGFCNGLGWNASYTHSKLIHVGLTLSLQEFWFPGRGLTWQDIEPEYLSPPLHLSSDARTQFSLRHGEVTVEAILEGQTRIKKGAFGDIIFHYALTPYQLVTLIQEKFFQIDKMQKDLTLDALTPDNPSEKHVWDWEYTPDESKSLPKPKEVACFLNFRLKNGDLDLEKAQFWIDQSCPQQRRSWSSTDEKGILISLQNLNTGLITIPEGRPRLSYPKLWARLFVGRWDHWSCVHHWIRTLPRRLDQPWSATTQPEPIQMPEFEIWRWIYLWEMYLAPRVVIDELLLCASPAEIRELTHWTPTVSRRVYGILHAQVWSPPKKRQTWELPFRDSKTGVRQDWVMQQYKGDSISEWPEEFDLSGSSSFRIRFKKEKDHRFRPVPVPTPSFYTMDSSGSDASYYWRFTEILSEMYSGPKEAYPRRLDGKDISYSPCLLDVWDGMEMT